MKITVITACYNSVTTIRDTIQSVENQTHNDIEYIVVDGSSNDGTLDVLREYRDYISTLVSEPDTGIFNAYNKGIDLAGLLGG